MKIRTNKLRFALLGAGLSCVLTLSSMGNAQTSKPLVSFAPSNAILTLELNNWATASRYMSAFAKEFQRLKLDQMLFSSLDIAQSDAKLINELDGLLDKEMFFSLGLTVVKGELKPTVLFSAKPSDSLSKKIQSLLDQEIKNSKSSGKKITTIDESGFKIFSDKDINMGYSKGVIYLSDDLTTVRNFIKGLAGKSGNYLGNSSTYSKTMASIGSATARVYLNVSSISGTILQQGIKEAGLGSQSFNVKALQNALNTFGQLAGGLSINAQGINATGILVPNANNGDSELYKLLLPKSGVNKSVFSAQKTVPASVLSFGTQSLNANQIYNYLVGFIERIANLKKDELNQVLKQELQLDLQKDLLSWMGNEMANAAFIPVKGGNTANIPTVSETVFYIKVNNLPAAQTGFKKSMMKLSELAQISMNGTSNKKPAPFAQPKTITINGTQVVRYVFGPGTSLSTAFKNGFLILSTDNGMLAALASGPRLADSNTFKTAFSKIPNTVLGYGVGDTAGTLQSLSSTLNDLFAVGLSQATDMKPSEAGKLADNINQMIKFVAQRTGNGISWSETTPQGPRMHSFTPIKW